MSEAAVQQQQGSTLERARAFALTLAAGLQLPTGENAVAHADGVAALLKEAGADDASQAVSYLLASWAALSDAEVMIHKQFGAELGRLAASARKLVILQEATRGKQAAANDERKLQAEQIEQMRKLVLAFGEDLRVVLLRLASRLQTLRYFADTKLPVPRELAQETLDVLAPIASRLGVWQFKWELEDLAFRFLQPDTYKRVANLLDEKRAEREGSIASCKLQLEAALKAQGVVGLVAGRPKHIYSIVKKMQGKSLDFAHVLDVRALRVITPDIKACYAVLGVVHNTWKPIDREFDDYIAHPKPNGYQSLHTVVVTDDGKPLEVQIRTQAMHEHAEYGVAAHWAYKEAGAKGYAGVEAAGRYEQKIALVRQLLAMQTAMSSAQSAAGSVDDHIYVLTPQATIVELPRGATPIDFAYHVHTDLGHRCRGAKVDGQMVPLNTALKTGQTVEINALKEGGPSRDWLNPELNFLASPRSRAKVRAWFNALQQEETIAQGRSLVDKLLQREGKTAVNLTDLAEKLGFKTPDALFEVVGKDEYSLRNVENALHVAAPEAAQAADAESLFIKKSRARGDGGVLVVGVGSLLTQLAKCCKPVPPDLIGGFVTRGKGVSVHRRDCVNFKGLLQSNAERVIPVEWGEGGRNDDALYPVDVVIEAADRQGLLRDISEVFAKEKINVVGVSTQTIKDTAYMTFTLEVRRSDVIPRALALVAEVKGVRHTRRK
jgi:GTP pyrophosphokinase